MGIQGKIKVCHWPGGNKGKAPDPFFLVMPALIALGIVLLIFIGKKGDRSRDNFYEDLDGRIKRIELRLGRMEQGPKPPPIDGGRREDLTRILERVEKLEKILKPQDPPARIRPPELQERVDPPKKSVTAPPPLAFPSTEPQLLTHLVVEGDTLFKISRQFGVTVDELRAWNNLLPEEGIRTGQKLRIERQGNFQ